MPEGASCGRCGGCGHKLQVARFAPPTCLVVQLSIAAIPYEGALAGLPCSCLVHIFPYLAHTLSIILSTPLLIPCQAPTIISVWYPNPCQHFVRLLMSYPLPSCNPPPCAENRDQANTAEARAYVRDGMPLRLGWEAHRGGAARRLHTAVERVRCGGGGRCGECGQVWKGCMCGACQAGGRSG